MKTQSFVNHVRVHPLYHYFAVPVSLALIPISILNMVVNLSVGSTTFVVATVILHLAIFLARDYAKKNQDRIIRLELRLRYFELTSKRLEEIEERFTTGQLLALRFASDPEFLRLVADSETVNKKPEEIKKQIVQWNPDLMRV